MVNKMKASELIHPQQTQLDRIEAKLDKLLANKKPKPRKAHCGVYPPKFEDVWLLYPKRIGSNPKRKALSAWKRRLWGSVMNEDMDSMFGGVKRYSEFCDATGKTGTEYVMQAATFFGPDKHYENDWDIPAQKLTVPRDDNQLAAFAVKHGLHKHGEAPQSIRNNFEYRRWIEEKL